MDVQKYKMNASVSGEDKKLIEEKKKVFEELSIEADELYKKRV